jgi:hypothetical protein
VKRVFGSIIEPLIRPLESKNPKSPLIFVTFDPVGASSTQDNTY